MAEQIVLATTVMRFHRQIREIVLTLFLKKRGGGVQNKTKKREKYGRAAWVEDGSLLQNYILLTSLKDKLPQLIE